MLRRRGSLVVPVVLIAAAPVATVVLAGTAIVLGASCSSDGSGAPPTAAAAGQIPTGLLAIYQQVGDQYDLPWQILAGIGQEECDQGRDPDPSCTPLPGAQGPGVANPDGASGPMQIGVGGLAGDAYRQLRSELPDPRLGPHDPMTAVELAALVLIKDKGAVPGQPIDAYAGAVTAYNGSGPAAQQYAQRVLADAQSYGSDPLAAGPGACQATDVSLVAGDRARILPDGDAEAPAGAPPAVQAMIAAGNRIDHFPYSYAGGHGAVAQTMSQTAPDPAAYPGEQENGGPGYDCSSATDYVLYGGGFGQTLLQGGAPASGSLEGLGDPGRGRWVTIYANPSHAYIEVAGIYLDTAAGEGRAPNPPDTGPRWTPVGTGPKWLRCPTSAGAVSAGGPVPREAQEQLLRGLADAALYGAYAERLLGIVARRVNTTPENVEDACHFAWAQYLSHAERVDCVHAWLATTAIHHAYKLHARQDRDESLERALENGAEPVAGDDVTRVVELREEIGLPDRLAPRQQRLIWLQAAGLSYREMSQRTGDSLRTTERQVLRARRRLADLRRRSERPSALAPPSARLGGPTIPKARF